MELSPFASLQEIASFLNSTLAHSTIKDTSLNGLQVDGNSTVNLVAVTVDASLETVKLSKSQGAQLLVAHHGLFWDRPFTLTGALGETTRELFQSGISLFASHLPLDAHATLGNNAILARMLDLEELTPAFPFQGTTIGWAGRNVRGLTLNEMRERLATLPGADLDMLTLPFGPQHPERVGIVSGSGSDALYVCASSGIDTLITGEARQFAYHFAKEHQLNAVFAGHYATETVGVQALGRLVEEQFKIPFVFINCPTGI